jgi:hypothetical protein
VVPTNPCPVHRLDTCSSMLCQRPVLHLESQLPRNRLRCGGPCLADDCEWGERPMLAPTSSCQLQNGVVAAYPHKFASELGGWHVCTDIWNTVCKMYTT